MQQHGVPLDWSSSAEHCTIDSQLFPARDMAEGGPGVIHNAAQPQQKPHDSSASTRSAADTSAAEQRATAGATAVVADAEVATLASATDAGADHSEL